MSVTVEKEATIKAKTVHNELQVYVKSKRIDSLVGNLLESLIKDRPEFFIGYIIDYIHTKYYDETKSVFENLAKSFTLFESDSKKYDGIFALHGKDSKDAKNVHAEVEEYLKNKSIHPFLNDLVERILTEKPNSPYSFIVTYLCSMYADECRPALEMILPKFSSKGITISSKEVPKPVTSSPTSAIPRKFTAAPSDTEDEEGEELNANQDEKMEEDSVVTQSKAKVSFARRLAVSAESFDPVKLKEVLAQIAIVPKSAEVIASLRKTLSRSPMLRSLDIEQKEAIVRAFGGPMVCTDGQNVIVQGDIGDSFYLLEEGFVDVYIRKKDMEEEVKVHTYKAGDAFGQLALLYNAPRAATCRVNTAAKLWVLDRVAFKVIVVSAAMQKREKYKSFLRQVAVLESLSEWEMLTLADSLVEETYQDGYTICKQGEEGNDFYIIKEGLALCFQTDEATGEEALVATLSKGQFFGEMALLTNKPRHATFRAKGVLRVLAIDRESFKRLFGSLEDIMLRNTTTNKA